MHNDNEGVQWVGLIITMGAISYLGFSVSSKTTKFGKDPKREAESQKSTELAVKEKKKQKTSGDENEDVGGGDADVEAADADDDGVGKSNYDDVDDDIDVDASSAEIDPDAEEKKRNVHFHIAMCFAAIYLAMVYTNWVCCTFTIRSPFCFGLFDILHKLCVCRLRCVHFIMRVCVFALCSRQW